MKKTIALFFSLHISLSMALPAQGSALKCEQIFIPDVAAVLEQVNRESTGYLFKNQTFPDYQKNLSWNKRRQLRRLLLDIQISKLPSEFAVEQAAIRLGNILFGKSEILDNYILKNSQDRTDLAATKLIQQQLLTEGLIKTWTDYSDPASVSRVARIMDKIWKIQNSKTVSVLALPYFLPKIKDRNLPQELIFKVLRDGMPAHKDEIKVVMQAQNYIQGYNTFRRLYTPVIMSVLLIVLLDEAKDNYDHMVDEQVTGLIQQLSAVRQDLEQKMPDLKKDQANAAYDEVVKNFVKEWGESPTQAESEKIRSAINKALNVE